MNIKDLYVIDCVCCDHFIHEGQIFIKRVYAEIAVSHLDMDNIKIMSLEDKINELEDTFFFIS